MKFAAFAFITLFCLVAVNAATVPEEVSNDYAEIEAQHFWKPIYWTFKKVLRTAKYLHCSIGVVFQMERSTEKYIANLHTCTTDFTGDVQNVAVSLKKVIDISNTILNINSKVCNYANPTEDALIAVPEEEPEANVFLTKWGCYWKLLKQFDNLEHQIVEAGKLVLGLPKNGTALADCMVDATHVLTTTYDSFNDHIKDCTHTK